MSYAPTEVAVKKNYKSTSWELEQGMGAYVPL